MNNVFYEHNIKEVDQTIFKNKLYFPRGRRSARTFTRDHEKELMDWLSSRSLVVTEAVEDATGKNPNYYGVTSLYGNDVIPKAMKVQPKLETAILPDYIKEAKDAAPVEVPNLKVFAKLKDFEIIQKGDLVKLRQPGGTFKIFIYAGE